MKKADVKKTLKNGIITNTPYIKIYTLLNLKNTDQQHIQTAFIVNKKVHTSAVKRHKYQRWMREIARQWKDFLPNNLNLVLIAKPNITQVISLKQLQESFFVLLSSQSKFWESLSNSKH